MNRPHASPLLDLLGIALPVIQAPMAGATTPAMVAAVSDAGGLGSLPSGLYSPNQFAEALQQVRAATSRPIAVNLLCHTVPADDAARQQAWRQRLSGYYVEAGLDPAMPVPPGGRAPFDAALCEVVEHYRPEVASFHFGLPDAALLDRVRRTGAKLIASATTVAEARWLEAHGVDAVIAMGAEAGGHRGNFLSDDMGTQIGTFALVPQIVDAVSIPVIAAGGIADRRGVRAAFALGAEAVQVGTAYLFTPEAGLSSVYRSALAGEGSTALTNLFTGRPARGIVNRLMVEIGPMSDLAPPYPTAVSAIGPLRAAAEAEGRGDYSPLWAGQAFPLATPMPAGELTRWLAGAISEIEEGPTKPHIG